MEEKTVDILLSDVFKNIDRRGTISFAFQGGEPTLSGIRFFESFVRKARECCPKDVILNFSIQTNGTLLTDNWISFFRKENFLVGISIDGTKMIHNQNRIFPDGAGSWKAVRQAADQLLHAGVPTNVLCVITAQCAKHPEMVYNELKKIGFRYIQFIACMDPMGVERGRMSYSLTPKAYGAFLCRIFDLWYRDWKTGNFHSIRLFDDYIHILLGDQGSTCSTCGQCGGYFVVEGDGSVFPCDFYVLDKWRLGKLGEHSIAQMAEGDVFQEFLKWGATKPTECGKCVWFRLCNGGCKNDWVEDAEGVHNYYCEAFKTLFAYGADRMVRIAQAERASRPRYMSR